MSSGQKDWADEWDEEDQKRAEKAVDEALSLLDTDRLLLLRRKYADIREMEFLEDKLAKAKELAWRFRLHNYLDIKLGSIGL